MRGYDHITLALSGILGAHFQPEEASWLKERKKQRWRAPVQREPTLLHSGMCLRRMVPKGPSQQGSCF